jgi:predicted RNA binding protein YcfA (HicA-like mRNA interferase family)
MPDRPSAGLLRNVSTRRIVRALESDGFSFTERQGSQRIYRHRMAAGSSCTIIVQTPRFRHTSWAIS